MGIKQFISLICAVNFLFDCVLIVVVFVFLCSSPKMFIVISEYFGF